MYALLIAFGLYWGKYIIQFYLLQWQEKHIIHFPDVVVYLLVQHSVGNSFISLLNAWLCIISALLRQINNIMRFGAHFLQYWRNKWCNLSCISQYMFCRIIGRPSLYQGIFPQEDWHLFIFYQFSGLRITDLQFQVSNTHTQTHSWCKDDLQIQQNRKKMQP